MPAPPDQDSRQDLPTSEEVLVRCGAWIRRTALRVRDRMPWADVDDLTQQGIMTALEMRERYHPERGVPFEVFIKPRVFGAMVDMMRQAGSMARHESDMAESVETEIAPRVIELITASENMAALTCAIDRLPDQERKVISLFYLSEFTNAEVARLMTLSEPKANRIRYRALSMLAHSIANDSREMANVTLAEMEN